MDTPKLPDDENPSGWKRLTIEPPGQRPKSPPALRVLSIDGAGIYGYVGARWLRQIWEKVPTFLAPDEEHQIGLFAGISSGAVNALLLAKHDDPREALRTRELEEFWKAPNGAFSNTNPTASALSMLGLTPLFSTSDFLRQLKAHFGEMKIGDLKHPVLIGTFNFHGTSGKIDFGDENDLQPMPAGFPMSLFSGATAAAKPQPSDGRLRQWRPKFFNNLRKNEPDKDYRVIDIAFAAAAPPPLRAIRGGLGDAAVFTANPSVECVTALLDLLTWLRPERRRALLNQAIRAAKADLRADAAERELAEICDQVFRQERTAENVQAKVVQGDAPRPEVARGADAATEQALSFAYDDETRAISEADERLQAMADKKQVKEVRGRFVELLMDEYTEIMQQVFRRARVLSVGDGVVEANYWLSNFALGNLPYSNLPTNPALGQWYPPSLMLALDAPRQSAHYVTERLLGNLRYHRLNPPLMELPTVVATMMTRDPVQHQKLVKSIDEKVETETSKRAIQESIDFVENGWLALGPVDK
jgi:hypothetical protein